MAFLTNEKLTIVGAAGMIGSNMAQTALMMGLTSEICLYDVFSPEGVCKTIIFDIYSISKFILKINSQSIGFSIYLLKLFVQFTYY